MLFCCFFDECCCCCGKSFPSLGDVAEDEETDKLVDDRIGLLYLKKTEGDGMELIAIFQFGL